MSADLSIQNAFLDGIEEVFQIMFTDQLEIQFLDETRTQTNVYEESRAKFYLDPVKIIGRVVIHSEKGEDPVEDVDYDATITIPTKQFITLKIPRSTPADFDNLKKARFRYKGIVYEIEKILPKTLVADEWQFYEFHCSVPKKNSLEVSKYGPPEQVW